MSNPKPKLLFDMDYNVPVLDYRGTSSAWLTIELLLFPDISQPSIMYLKTGLFKPTVGFGNNLYQRFVNDAAAVSTMLRSYPVSLTDELSTYFEPLKEQDYNIWLKVEDYLQEIRLQYNDVLREQGLVK